MKPTDFGGFPAYRKKNDRGFGNTGNDVEMARGEKCHEGVNSLSIIEGWENGFWGIAVFYLEIDFHSQREPAVKM